MLHLFLRGFFYVNVVLQNLIEVIGNAKVIHLLDVADNLAQNIIGSTLSNNYHIFMQLDNTQQSHCLTKQREI